MDDIGKSMIFPNVVLMPDFSKQLLIINFFVTPDSSVCPSMSFIPPVAVGTQNFAFSRHIFLSFLLEYPRLLQPSNDHQMIPIFRITSLDRKRGLNFLKFRTDGVIFEKQANLLASSFFSDSASLLASSFFSASASF